MYMSTSSAARTLSAVLRALPVRLSLLLLWNRHWLRANQIEQYIREGRAAYSCTPFCYAMPLATAAVAVAAAATAIVAAGVEAVVAAEKDQDNDNDPGAATKTVTHIEYASFRLQYIL